MNQTIEPARCGAARASSAGHPRVERAQCIVVTALDPNVRDPNTIVAAVRKPGAGAVHGAHEVHGSR